MPEKEYTPDEAAKVLNLSQRRVQQLCRLGMLGRKEGGRYVITQRELDAFKRVHAEVKPGPKTGTPKTRK